MSSAARFLIGTNHKTYFSHARALAWSETVARLCRDHPAVVAGVAEVFVLPTHLALPAVLAAVRSDGSPLLVGAQDASATGSGPHTGEVTAAELAEAGAGLVALGHAERRRDHGESDEVVAAKVAAVLRAGLLPLLCIGEPEPGTPEDAVGYCRDQTRAALEQARRDGLSGEVVLAYEPVWAIGAARAATAWHIRMVCRQLREQTTSTDDTEGVRSMAGPGRVIYGGSAGPGLLTEIAPDVDGVFLGRRAHDPQAVAQVLDEALAVAAPDPHPGAPRTTP